MAESTAQLIRPRAAPRVARRATRLSAALLLAACTIDDPTIFGTDERPEDLGTAIAGSDGVTDLSFLRWAPDGVTLYFEAGSPASLRATNVETGQTITVDGPRGDYIDLAFAPDGRTLYFAADLVNGQRTTYVLRSGASAEVLTDRAPGTLVTTPADGYVVLPGPSGEQVAYIVRPDSLYVYETTTATHRFIVADCTRAIAFSPDGGMLLCRGGTASGPYNRVALATAEASPIDLFPREASILKVIRWEDEAILTLYQTATRFRVRDVSGGATTTIWAPNFGQSYRVMDFINYAWSRDGSRFAFWLHECLRIDRVGACAFGQSVLHSVDMARNTGVEVAVAKGTRGAEQVAISVDRKLVAFVFDRRVWLHAIP